MMGVVKEVRIEEMENMGCNNGNYPSMRVISSTGEGFETLTCRCGNGCSGTCRRPKIGEDFERFFDEACEAAFEYLDD